MKIIFFFNGGYGVSVKNKAKPVKWLNYNKLESHHWETMNSCQLTEEQDDKPADPQLKHVNKKKTYTQQDFRKASVYFT